MTQFSADPRSESRTPRPAAEYDEYVDYKNVDELRRMMTPNGKIYSRKRLGLSARGQRNVAAAVKRARFMGLLPYTNATV